jgi:hypothetical protein
MWQILSQKNKKSGHKKWNLFEKKTKNLQERQLLLVNGLLL